MANGIQERTESTGRAARGITNAVSLAIALAIAVLLCAPTAQVPKAYAAGSGGLQAGSIAVTGQSDGWLWPVPDSTGISQYYWSGHDGLDITAYLGAPVLASKSGTVCKVLRTSDPFNANWQGYGNGVVIRHSDGMYTHYAHLNSVNVYEGQNVAQGTQIGAMGTTGNSTGVHLHFAIAWSIYGGGSRINNNPGAVQYYYGHNPEGYLDAAIGGDGTVHVRGWALDRDVPSTQLDVHVYVGGPAGSGEVHVVKANCVRSDVNRVIGVSGNHGFDATFKTGKRGNVKVYAYAINTQGGNNPQLVNVKTASVTYPPEGYLDSAKGGAGTVRVTGWAMDRDHQNSSTEVRIYIGGPAGSGEYHSGIVANRARADVNKVKGVSGNHGFDTTIKTNKRGTVKVYAYAVCKDANGYNPQLVNVKTVTISAPKTTKAKKANPIVVKTKSLKLSYAKVKKAGQTIAAKSAFTVSKAKGKVTYAKLSGNAKIKVSSAGKITVKKGIKKGLYPVFVSVKAAGNGSYKAATKVVVLTIRVK